MEKPAGVENSPWRSSRNINGGSYRIIRTKTYFLEFGNSPPGKLLPIIFGDFSIWEVRGQ